MNDDAYNAGYRAFGRAADYVRAHSQDETPETVALTVANISGVPDEYHSDSSDWHEGYCRAWSDARIRAKNAQDARECARFEGNGY